MKSIKDVAIEGKRVFIRADFNVPLDKTGQITDDIRIRTVIPTIEYALEKNAKVILASHMGRPKGKRVAEFSLKPVAAHLEKLLGRPVTLADDCIGDGVKTQAQEMKEGEILLLENLRFYGEETQNDAGFAQQLAGLCEVYVNNAFAVSHRAHASVAAITTYAPQSCAGLLLETELDYFSKAMESPKRPLVAIVGGAKVSSKLGALENMIERVDRIIIGGAMGNTFLKSCGYDVGSSMVEDDLVGTAGEIMKKAADKGVRFYIPVDVVIAGEFSEEAESRVVPVQEIPDGQMALDIGPASSLLYGEVLADAGTIVWNGPMGVFEMKPYSKGTMALVDVVADSSALTIVGGGDTDVAVHMTGKAEKMTYISTGGGAFLHLMEGKELPAVVALMESEK